MSSPRHHEADVVLRDGLTVNVRPVRSEDATAVRAFFERLSPESIALRFFSGFPDLDRAVRWATEVDQHRYGLVATSSADGRVVAHAGWEREPDRPERAEVAFAIADATQHNGLGTILLGQLIEAADQAGVAVLSAEVLPQNHRMLHVFRDSGFPVTTRTIPGVVLVELPTSLSPQELGRWFGSATAVGELSGPKVARWFRDRHATAAPATWNRELATLRAAVGWWRRRGWLAVDPTDGLEPRRERVDRTRALTRGQLERLFARRDLPLRERTLWRLLYETAARANELLALDVEDLDLVNRRARVRSKGGAIEWVFWQTGSAQLLPRLLAGRTAGPVFLGGRRPARAVAGLDLDPASGRARLSYRRAAELFRVRTGWTLHQLRHSALTHAAEDGTNLPLLLARSRHASVRSLERYARPGPEAVARHLAETDPARRRP